MHVKLLILTHLLIFFLFNAIFMCCRTVKQPVVRWTAWEATTPSPAPQSAQAARAAAWTACRRCWTTAAPTWPWCTPRTMAAPWNLPLTPRRWITMMNFGWISWWRLKLWMESARVAFGQRWLNEPRVSWPDKKTTNTESTVHNWVQPLDVLLAVKCPLRSAYTSSSVVGCLHKTKKNVDQCV